MIDPFVLIASESERVAAIAESVPLDASVPTTPAWCLRDLIAHLGEVQRFWAVNVRAANPESYTEAAFPEGEYPLPADDQMGIWLRESTQDLLAALAAAADEDPSWTWWGEPATAGAVARHQIQEAAVHRWDAEGAAGTASPLDGEIAADGVDEFIEVNGLDGSVGDGGTVRLVSTDPAGEWSIGSGDARTATVAGTASDLVLVLYGRVPLDVVEIDGDTALVTELLGSISTE